MKITSGVFQGFIRLYRLLNLLSIDVALGACVMAIFIAGIFDVTIPGVTVLALGLSVWIIYTVDHLNDARNIPHASHTKRHYFHQDQFKTLRAAVIAGLFIQSILIFFLPSTIIIKGLFMIIIVMLYFLLLWFFKYRNIYHKEIIISMVYTCGVSLPTLNLLDFDISYELLIIFLQVGSLAFCNLLIFALLEMKSDQLDHQSSIALTLGSSTTRRILYAILSTGLMLAIFLFIFFENAHFKGAQIIFMLMYIVSLIILSFRWFRINERFRYWGDALFFLPMFYILWM
jgi:hypothetical protein